MVGVSHSLFTQHPNCFGFRPGNVAVAVNFGSGCQAPLPFTCNMVQDVGDIWIHQPERVDSCIKSLR